MHQGAPLQCFCVSSTRFAVSDKFKVGQGRPWIEALLLNHVAGGKELGSLFLASSHFLFGWDVAE